MNKLLLSTIIVFRGPLKWRLSIRWSSFNGRKMEIFSKCCVALQRSPAKHVYVSRFPTLRFDRLDSVPGPLRYHDCGVSHRSVG